MSPRLLRILAPLLAVVVGLFGVYHLFGAGLALRERNWGFAVFYLVFGLGGLALAQALWRVRRRISRD